MRRRTLAALLCALPLGTQAQQPTAQAFIESIYRPYLAKGYPGAKYTDTARYFAPPLAYAIDRDMRESRRRNEPPELNGDPFIDAQEWEVTGLSVTVTERSGDRASAIVIFTQFGKPRRVTLDLIRTGAGWRIADIHSPSGSLRAVYKLP